MARATPRDATGDFYRSLVEEILEGSRLRTRAVSLFILSASDKAAIQAVDPDAVFNPNKIQVFRDTIGDATERRKPLGATR